MNGKQHPDSISGKSFQRFLTDENPDSIFPLATFIWKAKVPSKVQILGWFVVRGRVNTCDMLQEEGLHIHVEVVV